MQKRPFIYTDSQTYF